MEYTRYYWLNEDSRKFLSRGYIDEEPEQRIRDIANIAEKYLGMPGFAAKFENYMARGFYSLSTPVWINFGKRKVCTLILAKTKAISCSKCFALV